MTDAVVSSHHSGKTGSVCLAGTGPGDPGLVTLRVLDALQHADVVVYDHLVSPAVLDLIPSGVRKIYAGKKSGAHSMPQEAINSLLVSEAAKGNSVVRLKGGDPFVFGRGGEELEALISGGIPCEVIPGITSAVAVPSYAGIPVTHRGVSSSFHVFTGHSSGGVVPGYDFKAMAAPGGTLVFLMGTASAAVICRNLISAGMAPSVPAAAVADGTTAAQKTVVSTVSALPEAMSVAGIQPPAVIVIGEAVKLSGKFGPHLVRPLSGLRIIVTRPQPQCADTCRELCLLGAEALACPVIAVRDTPAAKLPPPAAALEGCDWVTFVSASGVDAFFRQLFAAGLDGRSLAGKKIAAIGPATAARLACHGIRADLLPSCYDSISLAHSLCTRVPAGLSVLSVRNSCGDTDMEEILVQHGWTCRRFDVYGIVPVQDMSRETAELVAAGKFDWLVFASASAAEGFSEAFPRLDCSSSGAVCIGEKTAEAVRRLRPGHIVTAPRATAEGIVEALVSMQGTASV
jgi:uroporphyrinogen III methyltransferase / synthase